MVQMLIVVIPENVKIWYQQHNNKTRQVMVVTMTPEWKTVTLKNSLKNSKLKPNYIHINH